MFVSPEFQPEIEKRSLPMSKVKKKLEKPALSTGKPKRVSLPELPKTMSEGDRGPGSTKKPPTIGYLDMDSDSSSDSSSSTDSSMSSSESDKSDKPKRRGVKPMSRGGRSSKRGEDSNDGSKVYSTVPGIGYKPAQYKGSRTNFQGDNQNATPALLNIGSKDKVLWSVGLKPTTTINEFFSSTYPSSGETIHKVFVNTGDMSLPYSTSANSTAYNYLLEIFNVYYRDVLAVIRNTALSTAFTFAGFQDYIINTIQILQLYWALDSILCYDTRIGSEKDKNLTFIQYQSNFQDFTNIIQKKDYLEKIIKGLWFPPRYHQFIRWMFQNYKTSSLEQAAIIRFVPINGFLFDNSYAINMANIGSAMTTLITNFTTDTNAVRRLQIATALNQVYPDGRITSLPKSCAVPVYDVNFMELFINQPTNFTDETSASKNSVYPWGAASGGLTDIPYFVLDDPLKVDGFVFATVPNCTATSYGSNGMGYNPVWTNGLIWPFINAGMSLSNQSSKYVINNTTNVPTMTRRSSNVACLGAPDCNNAIFNGTGYYATAYPLIGTQRVYYDNINAPIINQGYYMDWLFNVAHDIK